MNGIRYDNALKSDQSALILLLVFLILELINLSQ